MWLTASASAQGGIALRLGSQFRFWLCPERREEVLLTLGRISYDRKVATSGSLDLPAYRTLPRIVASPVARSPAPLALSAAVRTHELHHDSQSTRMTFVRLSDPRPPCPLIHFCILLPDKPPFAMIWVAAADCMGLRNVSGAPGHCVIY